MDQRVIDNAKLSAERAASRSHSKRRQVGAVAVTSTGMIIADGHNQMPAHMNPNCEDKDGQTRREVIHAEAVMLAGLKHTILRADVSVVVVTKEPCRHCAELLMNRLPGLQAVFYRDVSVSKPNEGLSMLRIQGVETHRYVS